jgi:hypothetical protein
LCEPDFPPERTGDSAGSTAAPAGLVPDLLTHAVIGRKLVLVVELIGPEASGLLLEYARRLDHIARELAGHTAALAADDLQIRSEDAHVIELFARESI